MGICSSCFRPRKRPRLDPELGEDENRIHEPHVASETDPLLPEPTESLQFEAQQFIQSVGPAPSPETGPSQLIPFQLSQSALPPRKNLLRPYIDNIETQLKKGGVYIYLHALTPTTPTPPSGTAIPRYLHPDGIRHISYITSNGFWDYLIEIVSSLAGMGLVDPNLEKITDEYIRPLLEAP